MIRKTALLAAALAGMAVAGCVGPAAAPAARLAAESVTGKGAVWLRFPSFTQSKVRKV